MIKVLKILKILISHIGCYFDVKCKILLIFYFKEKYGNIFDAPTSAQATTAPATTAQVKTAPGGQLPLGDNCPGKTTAPVGKGDTLFVSRTQARQKILGAKCSLGFG